ncbi:MAG: sulfotransferase family protein [Pseudonocardiaceae bacterium]
MNTGAVFVCAAPYSGSTLLGVMLGAHPSIFCAGEARNSRYLGDPSTPLKRRVCKLCGPDCVVWGNLRVEHRDGPYEISLEHEKDLYEMLSRRTKRPIVCDSSKRIGWIKYQVAALHDVVPLHLIVLARDGRAVVNSRLCKRPEIPAREHAAAWVERIHRIEELASRWPGAVHRMRYEELASRPESTLRALADFLGIAFDPAMLNPWNSDQHPLGGNAGPLLLLLRERASSIVTGVINPNDRARAWYGAHPCAIVLDLRWKHELSAEALAMFEEVAGETNRAYAWEESVE